jgi:hypothetical protein
MWLDKLGQRKIVTIGEIDAWKPIKTGSDIIWPKIVNKKYLSMSGNEANPPRDMMKHKLGSCPIMFKLTYSKRVLFLVKKQVAW